MLLTLLRLEARLTGNPQRISISCVENYITNYSCGRISREGEVLFDKGVTDR